MRSVVWQTACENRAHSFSPSVYVSPFLTPLFPPPFPFPKEQSPIHLATPFSLPFSLYFLSPPALTWKLMLIISYWFSFHFNFKNGLFPEKIFRNGSVIQICSDFLRAFEICLWLISTSRIYWRTQWFEYLTRGIRPTKSSQAVQSFDTMALLMLNPISHLLPMLLRYVLLILDI